jgi:hypothetical protein
MGQRSEDSLVVSQAITTFIINGLNRFVVEHSENVTSTLLIIVYLENAAAGDLFARRFVRN